MSDRNGRKVPADHSDYNIGHGGPEVQAPGSGDAARNPMATVKVSDALRSNYEDYYSSEDPEWRRLGAIGKVDNILALCGDLPHRSILEIGAGEGSILQRLSELCFAEELRALEISPS